MSLIQRPLLTPSEVLRINRPYTLVMFSGQNPAMTIAPDLSKWLFNRILSLGDEEFCTKVRIIRETARNIRTNTQIPIWEIDKQIQEVIEQQKAIEEAERYKRLEERRFNFRNVMPDIYKERMIEEREDGIKIEKNETGDEKS